MSIPKWAKKFSIIWNEEFRNSVLDEPESVDDAWRRIYNDDLPKSYMDEYHVKVFKNDLVETHSYFLYPRRRVLHQTEKNGVLSYKIEESIKS